MEVWSTEFWNLIFGRSNHFYFENISNYEHFLNLPNSPNTDVVPLNQERILNRNNISIRRMITY